jgi:hypothetical protein
VSVKWEGMILSSFEFRSLLIAGADQLVLGGWSSPYMEYIEKIVVSDDARCSSVENLGDCAG